MRRLLIGLTLVVLALPVSAFAGGWATVGMKPPDDGVGPGDTWDAQMTVLQHGNPETPLSGLSPTVTIRKDGTSKTFKATAADKPGAYVAHVVFPSAGTWSYEVYDGFTQYGGQQTHKFPSVSIGAAGAGGGFPTMTVTSAIALMLVLGLLIYVVARRLRVRAPAPTH